MKKVLLGLILISPTYYAYGAVNDPFATPPRRPAGVQQAPGAPLRTNEGGLPPIHGDFSFAPLNFTFPVIVSGSSGATPPGGEPN